MNKRYEEVTQEEVQKLRDLFKKGKNDKRYLRGTDSSNFDEYEEYKNHLATIYPSMVMSYLVYDILNEIE